MEINEDFMNSVGLADMPEAEKKAFMAHAKEELEVRVGRAVTEQLTPAQLSEFENVTPGAGARKWLETNLPDFRKIVKDIYNEFRDEIKAEKEEIL